MVEVCFPGHPERTATMSPLPRGYFEHVAAGVHHGDRYQFRLDGGQPRPDPASRWQPEGVHGASAVVDRRFAWDDAGWGGVEQSDLVIYELHVGTFTPQGTLREVEARLDSLADLGVTAVELMPLAQFPGARNWGYDGVYPFAVQDSYGGVTGLKRLVNACHKRGLAVILDMVNNHLGPEGNYLAEFGPYFTDDYRTPWGPALNFDGPHSDEVRKFFLECALVWQSEFHLDGLRLDAVHAIKDFSAYPFLQELVDVTHAQAAHQGHPFVLIAESDQNDPRLIRPAEQGGYGLDAQWSDDFHHALHSLLTGERNGYYMDFGDLRHLATAFQRGAVYTGVYSEFRHRRHGSSLRPCPASRFVVASQTHDQAGNRAMGERLSKLVDFESLKLAAATVILSPYLPLLFMGEEHGEEAPFLYFTSHGDPALVAAVRRGRREEFAAFSWQGEIPDPQDEQTLERSRLDWKQAGEGPHARLRSFYRELIRLRRTIPSLRHLSKDHLEVTVWEARGSLQVRRWTDNGDQAVLLLNYGDRPAAGPWPLPPGEWLVKLESAAAEWGGAAASLGNVLTSQGEPNLTVARRGALLLHRPEAH